MIEHPFLSIPAKTACPGKVRLIFSKISRATRLAGFVSIMLPLDINRSLYNVLMSQEVRGMQASAQVWYTSTLCVTTTTTTTTVHDGLWMVTKQPFPR